MSSTINDLKINIDNYIELYKKEFEKLINQKDKDRTYQIDQKISKNKKEKIFKIEENEDFEENFYNCIRLLLNIKPGRLLIKELNKKVYISRKEHPDDSILIKDRPSAFKHHS